MSCLLGTGFLATRLARLLHLPHSVLLVLLGILAGWVTRSLDYSPSAETWSHFPDVVLYVLLPPLVFDSAYHMDFNGLRKDRWPLLFLAVFALLASCLVIGAGLKFGLGLDWRSALLFGALISATDPVAVVALFRELGARERLTLLVEGESLLNDGTAIVLFRVLMMGASQGANLVLEGATHFLTVSLGGVLVGMVLIIAFRSLLRWTADSSGQAQIGLTLTAAYLSFVLADHWLGASGVLATLTVGLYLGARARLTLNREALHSMHTLWDFFALCSNTVIFLAVGLSVDGPGLARAAPYLPLTLLVVYGARWMSVSVSLSLVNWLKLSAPISRGEQLVILWGGLRGGLALALVLLLPDTFAHKELFLALATAVVLTSLLVNALTISWLMARLGLNRLTPEEEDFLGRSLSHALEEVFRLWQKSAQSGGLSAQLVSEMRDKALESLPQSEANLPMPFAIRQLLAVEQSHYDHQFELGILSSAAYTRLSGAVQLRLRILEEGDQGLTDVSFLPQDLGLDSESPLELTLELLLHLSLALEAAPISSFQKVERLRQSWLAAVRFQLDSFQRSHPALGTAVQSDFLVNTLCAGADRALQSLLESKIINATVYARAHQDLSRFHREIRQETEHLRRLTFRDVLERVPLFATLSERELAQVEAWSRRHALKAGTVLFQTGEPGNSFFVILSGILEVHRPGQGAVPRMFAGSFFGELSLLFEVPRTATVTAVVDSDVVEIERLLFNQLQALSRPFQEHVRKIAVERSKQTDFTGS